jgi:hypothetical protein
MVMDCMFTQVISHFDIILTFQIALLMSTYFLRILKIKLLFFLELGNSLWMYK